jgi:hypothetical protein
MYMSVTVDDLNRLDSLLKDLRRYVDVGSRRFILLTRDGVLSSSLLPGTQVPFWKLEHIFINSEAVLHVLQEILGKLRSLGVDWDVVKYEVAPLIRKLYDVLLRLKQTCDVFSEVEKFRELGSKVLMIRKEVGELYTVDLSKRPSTSCLNK